MFRLLITILLVAALGGCQRKAGPFERAGTRADEIRDNVAEGRPALHEKSTLEKTGEAIDDALDTDRRR